MSRIVTGMGRVPITRILPILYIPVIQSPLDGPAGLLRPVRETDKNVCPTTETMMVAQAFLPADFAVSGLCEG